MSDEMNVTEELKNHFHELFEAVKIAMHNNAIITVNYSEETKAFYLTVRKFCFTDEVMKSIQIDYLSDLISATQTVIECIEIAIQKDSCAACAAHNRDLLNSDEPWKEIQKNYSRADINKMVGGEGDTIVLV